MTGGLDHSALRAAAPPEQALLLHQVLAAPGSDMLEVTDQLVESISKGSLSPHIVQIWLGVTRDLRVTVFLFLQTRSLSAQRLAMPHLRRHLRRESTFASTWEAVGGVEAIAAIMAQLSVHHVRQLCVALCGAVPAGGTARTECQQRMSELLSLLRDESRNPDVRPLNSIYDRILPACTADAALEWTERMIWAEGASPDSGSERLFRRLQMKHRVALERRAFQHSFEKSKGDLNPKWLNPFVGCDLNLELGIQILDKFAGSDTLRGVEAGYLMNFVALPLMKRRMRRSLDGETHTRIGRLANTCLQRHVSLRHELEPQWDGAEMMSPFITYAIKAWKPSTTRVHDEEVLAVLLNLVPRGFAQDMDLASLAQLVRPSLRYRFLRLFLRHSSAYGFDIGSQTDTNSTILSGFKVSPILFTSLLPVEAFNLFERVLEANPDLSFLTQPTLHRITSVLATQQNFEGSTSRPDVHILRALLLYRVKSQHGNPLKNSSAISDHLRVTELSQRKSISTQCRKPEERASWAIQALHLCVALGDLELYADTLKWARRCNKDPIVVKTLYRREAILTVEALDLISALPAKATQMNKVEEKILQGNRVVETLLETATMALREPSFQAGNWSRIPTLITEVVQRRLERFGPFQACTGMSNDQVFESVLQPTLDLVLNAEALFLTPEHKPLMLQAPDLMLNEIMPTSTVAVRGPTIKFFDRLARGRDELWKRHRARTDPSILTLEAPWPRGLPVQFLLPHFGFSFEVPYVKDRVQAVVFCEPDVAFSPVPTDEVVQAAVGDYIDGWSDALRLYLQGADGDEARKRRISEAWEHVTGKLKDSRMSTTEAQRRWRDSFERAGLHHAEMSDMGVLKLRLPAELPSPGEPGQPIEWDPDPTYRVFDAESSKDRRMSDVRCIDCMREQGLSDWKPNLSLVDIVEITITGIPKPCGFWHQYMTRPGLNDNAIMSYIIAAVLFLNGKHGSDTSVFLKAPPGGLYPAVYLSEDFLERHKEPDWGATAILGRFRSHSPPWLIAQLAGSILLRIQVEENESRRPYLMFENMIKLLLESNDPSAAIPLIQEFITQSPEASAWHRQLLSPGTLCKLAPSCVADLLVSLAREIIARLKKQAGSSKPPFGESSSEITPGQPPLVKVTTVKMLAQLLRDSRFVRPRLAVDILAELLQNATHLDIRLAAVASLISAAKETKLNSHVMDLLRIHVLPLASSLNERRPETEANWEEARKGGSLPTVWHDDETPPVLDLLLRNHSHRLGPEVVELNYEVLRVSAEKNHEWMHLFLRKHGLSMTDTVLPRVPAHPGTLLRAIRHIHMTQVPPEDFEVIRKYVLLLLEPPQDIIRVTRFVKKDAELALSNAGRHWLKTWEVEDPLQLGGYWAANNVQWSPMLESDVKAVLSERIELFVMEMAEVLLRQGNVSRFGTLCQNIRTSTQAPAPNTAERGPWRVKRRLIERVDSLRTPEWQADGHRQPARLPDTLQLHLDLLPVLGRHAHPEDVSHFTNEVINLLENLSKSGVPYQARYQKILNTVQDVHPKLQVAVLLGRPSRFKDRKNPTLADHLRVQISAVLVGRVMKLDDEQGPFAEEVRGMVLEWEESAVEEVRDVARTTREEFSSSHHYNRAGNWLKGDEDPVGDLDQMMRG